jgi:beta-phosphoglucomutase-like phosphatase (HAD superfamily)
VSISAVVFDLDGVIIDTEEVWEEVRRGYAAEYGRQFLPDSQARMMGMSTGEWSTHLSADVGVPRTPEQVASDVLGRMAARYRESLPLIPGSVEAVRRLAVIAVPHGVYPPAPDALAQAALVIDDLDDLTVEAVEKLR